MREYRKVIKGIIVSGIVIISCHLMGLISFTSLSDPKNADICWNIITINSVFAGFMFTSLSILIGVLSSDTIKRLEKASLMEEIYKNIFCGIYCSLLSIVFSLVAIFIGPNVLSYLSLQKQSVLNGSLINIVTSVIPFLMIYTLILSILCFLGSVIDVKFIIKDLRKRLNKGSISEESKREVLKKIR